MLRDLLSGDGCLVLEADGAPPLAAPAPPAHLSLLLIAAASAHQTVGTLAGLRQRGLHAPTVVLTRAPTPWLRRQAFLLAVRDVITLPAPAPEVRTRLRVARGPEGR
jgi:hypothetical protein